MQRAVQFIARRTRLLKKVHALDLQTAQTTRSDRCKCKIARSILASRQNKTWRVTLLIHQSRFRAVLFFSRASTEEKCKTNVTSCIGAQSASEFSTTDTTNQKHGTEERLTNVLQDWPKQHSQTCSFTSVGTALQCSSSSHGHSDLAEKNPKPLYQNALEFSTHML